MLDECRFARPFHTFRIRRSKYVSRFDASLEGIGILIGLLNEDDPELPPVWMWGGAVSLLELKFGTESKYQNLGEFIGIVLIVLILGRLGLSGEAVELQGVLFKNCRISTAESAESAGASAGASSGTAGTAAICGFVIKRNMQFT